MTVHERRARYVKGLTEPSLEYDLQKIASTYLKTFYPHVEFRVDLAGLNLSNAQAGKAKAVNKRRSWPDLEIYDPSGEYFGLCIELKVLCTKIRREKDATKPLLIEWKKTRTGKIPVREGFRRRKGMYYDLHIEEQGKQLNRLRLRGRAAGFGIGVQNLLAAIDYYFEEPRLVYRFLEQ